MNGPLAFIHRFAMSVIDMFNAFMAQMEMSTEASYIITIVLVKFELRNTLSLGPAYNEFGYNEQPATTSNIFSPKRTLRIDINVQKVGYNE